MAGRQKPFGLAAGMLCAWTALLLRAETLPPASERFAGPQVAESPDFQRHVVPLLGRLGCNGRSCHGSFQGQGGLRLSLFGYDFQMDHQALTGRSASSGSPRLDRGRPEDSLLLRKPTLQMDHEGGQRFPVGSWQYRLMQRWIESGAKEIQEQHVLLRLDVEPAEVVFGENSVQAALRVTAVWATGQREDVTPLCRFRSNNDAVASVNTDGLVTSAGAGDTHVIAFYDNGIAAVPVLRPQSLRSRASIQNEGFAAGMTAIDSLILAKLNKLGIEPAEICTDAEFLRRVSIDLTGTLPTPDEIESFLSDRTDGKRAKKVDELLKRPAYAAWWANKLCDFTGCNPIQQAELGQETSAQWYLWIYRRLRENMPYNELVRRIVLARSRKDGQSYDDFAAETSAYFRTTDPADFSQRDTMPHYWTRRSMQKPDEVAQAFAHSFLGIRFQCAQCHKHPFAPWTQDDFKSFSRFFDNVKYGVEPQALARYRELAKQVGLNVRDDKGSAVSAEVLKLAQQGQTVPWRELYISDRQKAESLELLRSRTITLQGKDDPREAIMQWVGEPENPWFARAFVNRVWASYFHVGIIEPPDDLNPANPPSNPALLDWLTMGFVQQGYNMQWLHRQIVNSDAYQRGWKPNDLNRNDRSNFSRAVPRRMPAEVVYDSIKQALASSAKTEDVRTDLSRRAIGELSMRLAGTYAMQIFGKPDRAVNCDCERVNQPTLLQSIFLQNDPLVSQQLADSGWLKDIAQQEAAGAVLDTQRLITIAWLRTISRPPTAAELARATDHLAAAESTTDGLRDVLWALINTKEFVLIH